MASPSPKNTKKTRARLGRGLSALVEQRERGAIEVGGPLDTERNTNNSHGHDDPAPGVERVVHEIVVEAIAPNPNQPRRVFDPEALAELAESIKTHGLMQPVVVRRAGAGDGYELIAGERRWRAARMAGQARVRAVVLDVDESQSAQLALIENIQREGLNAIERARGFASLIARYSMTQEQVASRVGLSRPSVANLLRLLELDEDIQSMVASGSLSAGHAKALLSCDPSRRADLAERAVREGWSVRELERGAARDGHAPEPEGDGGAPISQTPTPTRVESVLRDLENRLSEKLGTRVTLKTNSRGTKGRVVIEFYDLDQFDGLLARFGVSGGDPVSASS